MVAAEKERRLALWVSPETQDRLKHLGMFGESYQDIVIRLMDQVEECKASHHRKRTPTGQADAGDDHDRA